jgi:hypothetical protein
MIAAGRGVKPTKDDVNLAWELLDKHVKCPTIRRTISIVLNAARTKSMVDRYHIEALKYFDFNHKLDVENANFKICQS